MLLGPYAIASLVAQSSANLAHRCAVQQTTDGRTWTDIAGQTDLPCRLSRPSPRDVRGVGDTGLSAVSLWVLALEAGSPHAGARLRFIVTGSEHDYDFTRTLYSIGGLTPLAQTAEARVLCSEEPLAIAGT